MTLHYDNVTLSATSLSFVAGPLARHPLTWWYRLAGVLTTGTVPVNTAVSTHTFSAAIQGVNGTDIHGGAIINWGLSYGMGHAVAASAV